jgi:S1-C subfamily serine protease
MRALAAAVVPAVSTGLEAQSLRAAGFLGVKADVVAARSEENPGAGLPGDGSPQGHLVVVQVLPGSPAEVAGILAGDEILEIGDQPVSEATEIMERIAALHPGTEVRVKLLRKGVPVVMTPTVGDRSFLDWIEHQDRMNLAHQKRIRHSIRQLDSQLRSLEQQRERFR